MEKPASGRLVVVTSSSLNTQAEPGALREDLSDLVSTWAHTASSRAAPRVSATLTHTPRRAPASCTRTRILPWCSPPGPALRPRATAPSRRHHHGCQQLLPSAVQQPRPPAGPPRAGGTAPGRWPCSWLACTPGLSEDGRVAVPAASPSQ